MNKRKTPQEKKALSYKKDCRNDYGEHDKGSRNTIPLRKALQKRNYRRKTNQILNQINEEISFRDLDLIETQVKSVNKGNWKKCSDAPLGEYIARQLEKRENRIDKGKTLRQEITEIIGKLKFESREEKGDIWVAEVIGLEQFSAKAESSERAIEKARYIAKAAFENALGFDVGILIDGDYIKPILEIKERK